LSVIDGKVNEDIYGRNVSGEKRNQKWSHPVKQTGFWGRYDAEMQLLTR
jgi:hypothetical protein